MVMLVVFIILWSDSWIAIPFGVLFFGWVFCGFSITPSCLYRSRTLSAFSFMCVSGVTVLRLGCSDTASRLSR